MKKEIKVVAIVLVALIVFLAGFGLGATKGININIGSESGINVNVSGSVSGGSQQVVAPTQAPVTQAPVTQAPTQAPVTEAPTQAPATDAPATDAPATEAPATDAPATDAPATDAPAGNTSAVPSTKGEIVAAYNKAVNDAKHYEGKVTIKKHDIIDVQLKDLPGIAAAIINPVISKLTATNPEEYVFDGGKDVNDPNRLVSHKIVPNGRDVAVQEAGVTNATATPNADGGYTMVLTFVAESSTFDGTKNTSEPTHHKTAMDPLDLGSLDLGDAISITQADLKYPGATMTATVDGQGRLVKLEQKLPMSGSGTGKAGISLTLNLEGSMDGTYEFIYG